MDATFEYRQNIFISFLSDGPVQYRDIGNAYDVGVDMNSLIFVFQTDENNFSYIKVSMNYFFAAVKIVSHFCTLLWCEMSNISLT